MARLQLDALHKRYDGTPVLTDLSLDIADGEFVALVGPSGCGKSTLLRTIAGLERIDAGQIRFDGKPVTDEPPQRRGVAMVFQGYALYPHMSVRGNLAFGLEQQRLARDEIERRIARAASALQLDALLDRRPSQLSGGQRQRVAMGRAMVREPLAFLFDEPLSNLDAQLRVQLRTEIRLLQQRLGTTTVYVTHDQEEAMTMADRIVVLRDGRIEQIGDPLTLYDRPANLFVARFIGSPPMNLLDVVAAPEGLLVGPGGLWWAPAGAAHAPGTRLQLGVRPEHLRLVTGDASRDAPGDAGAGRVQLAVQRVDSLGAQTELHGPVVGAPADQRWLARLPGRPDVQPGQVVTLDWRPAHAHLFDATSGERIAAGHSAS